MDMENRDFELMGKAIELAECAAKLGEVPVGALIVDNKTGEIISAAHNLRENKKMATAHAEILAIEEACAKRGDWRLSGCTLYVTLEPCPMCAGAIVNSRIDRVVYGASDALAGCCGSVINFNSYPFNHAFSLTCGVCEEECRALLQAFFKGRRG
jgi:tRNA(adenine34) deaminase